MKHVLQQALDKFAFGFGLVDKGGNLVDWIQSIYIRASPMADL